MPFRKEATNQSYCVFDDSAHQQQQFPSPSSHGNASRLFHHPLDYSDSSKSYFTPSLASHNMHNNEHQQQQDIQYRDNNNLLLQFENFIFPTPEEEKKGSVSLPCGWTLAGRKRSIFELETNIHTLGELHTTLIELRNQLPPQETELQQQQYQQLPPFISRQSSSFTASDHYTELSRRSSSNLSMSLPSSSTNKEYDLYYALTSMYPDFIFVSLLNLLASSECGCSFVHNKKNNLAKLFQEDKLNKAYASAIFAYAALHAILCHSEKYGIYSFLNDLACDAYYTAYELLEFDTISTTTVETLVLMHQYLYLQGKEGEARNLFCLGWRHMELLEVEEKLHHHYDRLLLWMAELDWIYSVTKDCNPPLIDPKLITKKMLKSISAVRPMEDVATKYRIKGLYKTLNNVQLNEWRSKYLQTFLYKRDPSPSAVYNTEDRLALQLHGLYFSGMLNYYQHQMMSAFEEVVVDEEKSLWTDYFSSTTTRTKTRVEKNLYSCMNAAYGFIHVVKLLLDEGDTCQLPYMMDTLSAAYTVLHFGNKVTGSSSISSQQQQRDVLLFVVTQLSTSALLQYYRVDKFVKTWRPLM